MFWEKSKNTSGGGVLLEKGTKGKWNEKFCFLTSNFLFLLLFFDVANERENNKAPLRIVKLLFFWSESPGEASCKFDVFFYQIVPSLPPPLIYRSTACVLYIMSVIGIL